MTTLDNLKDVFLNSSMSDFTPIEIRNSGNRMSLIAYRKPPFQVELVMWMPGVVIPAHRHPNIDAFEVHVSGDMVLLLGEDEAKTNDLINRAKVWPAKRIHDRITRVRPTSWHGGKAGQTGAAFWSIQHWTEGVELTAAGIDWDGPELVEPKLAKLCG